SRTIGGLLFMIGLVVGALYVVMCSEYWVSFGFGDTSLIQDINIMIIIKETLFYLAATAIGALVGIGIFLGAIMKA
ncbi:MAG: hypothetical protein KAT70_09685, partial [Thermoplasmata archaeon]|nr:hypothetical protein [Thermoplasmata archaeon]